MAQEVIHPQQWENVCELFDVGTYAEEAAHLLQWDVLSAPTQINHFLLPHSWRLL